MRPDPIIELPFEAHHPIHSLLQDALDPDELQAAPPGRRLFTIRSANSHGQRSSASVLIKRMYATRGYQSPQLPAVAPPQRITLVASDHEVTIGTITIGFDSAAGLHVDDLFGEQTAALRQAGRRICEFTTLAMDSVVRSKRVLASLFHVAYIYGHRVMGFDDLLIEVNPRHVRYYQRMLGFEALGPQRVNQRVNAPAVLMCLDFAHAHDQIECVGGKPDLALHDRSLYPHFFSPAEESGIVGRLRRAPPEDVQAR